MDSADERVALMAADKMYEPAWGKPREYDPARDDETPARQLIAQVNAEKLTPAELDALEKFSRARVAAVEARARVMAEADNEPA